MVRIIETNAIFCIAIDRFIAVVYPLRHPNIINTHVMTVLSWGIAVVVLAGFYLGFFVWGRSQFEWPNEWPKARSILGGYEFFGNVYMC